MTLTSEPNLTGQDSIQKNFTESSAAKNGSQRPLGTYIREFLKETADSSKPNIQEQNESQNWLDLAGLLPPLPLDVSRQIFATTGGKSSSEHTFEPSLIHKKEFHQSIAPKLEKLCTPDVYRFIIERVGETLRIREKLNSLKETIFEIVGKGNFSALWLDRESFSSDSMEHRSLITEAVIHCYSILALQKIVTLLNQHDIPIIPYGEGGGYNMGVTPMAPAVTLSVRGIDHIHNVVPHPTLPEVFEITVGAGVPFKDLIQYISKRGYVLRCDPNTPRASVGGIAATGSNGGRKAFEVISKGRAILAGGKAVHFRADAKETKAISSEPFLMAQKFFGIDSIDSFEQSLKPLLHTRLSQASVSPNDTHTNLSGIKGQANMLAQNFHKKMQAKDSMLDAPVLPLSAFVGAEGTTGIIYEVTFMIEKPKPFVIGMRWHFSSTQEPMVVTKAIKSLPIQDQPVYFELITGASIKRFLLSDYPTTFHESDACVLFLGIEGSSPQDVIAKAQDSIRLASRIIVENGFQESSLTHSFVTQPEATSRSPQFDLLKKPRESLPKKLRTKVKTDMEVRFEYLSQVLEIVEQTQPKKWKDKKVDVLFGHLTPNHTAILHWNIGGFDIYNEEESQVAWEYLENVIGKAQNLAPKNDAHGSARFSGEHGMAGKAPFLWINYIDPAEYSKMCRVKDLLDPKDLMNPNTLFLKTSVSRQLRSRLISSSDLLIRSNAPKSVLGKMGSVRQSEDLAITEALKCTRCNSCKICPVIDAEHELEREGKRDSNFSVLPSKRNILLFLERIALTRRAAEETKNIAHITEINKVTTSWLKESASLLKKCFYCRKCDKACPVDINLSPLVKAYQGMGQFSLKSPFILRFLYERLMGDDVFKAATYRLLAFLLFISAPFLRLLRAVTFIPNWLKTYTVPPSLSMIHYEPKKHGTKMSLSDNFFVIGSGKELVGHSVLAPFTIFIRFRGCADTFGNPGATESVDSYFRDELGIKFLDLEKKICCGFPFQADGLLERAAAVRFSALLEITKTILKAKKLNLYTKEERPLKFVVFSNCPTCCEAIRDMNEMILDPRYQTKLRQALNLDTFFSMDQLHFESKDTAEIALEILKKAELSPGSLPQRLGLKQNQKSIGIKVPCHNTTQATEAQKKLLSFYYSSVNLYDRCCGLSGTSRLKHPKIGTKIAEKLFESMSESPTSVVVSGCPSCRDGVTMQRDIMLASNTLDAKFEVQGIFQQILIDSSKAERKNSISSLNSSSS